jgi:hypothetical protein
MTSALVRRPGFGTAFERCNTNIVEEALCYAAKSVSRVEQANLDLLWDVNLLLRLHNEGRVTTSSDYRSGRRIITSDADGGGTDSSSSSGGSSSSSRRGAGANDSGSTGFGGGGGNTTRNNSSAACAANLSSNPQAGGVAVGVGSSADGGGGGGGGAEATAARQRRRPPPAVSVDAFTNARIQEKSDRCLTNRFHPRSIDEDIEEGYFFRRHWWGDKRWRKLMQLMAQQQVRVVDGRGGVGWAAAIGGR